MKRTFIGLFAAVLSTAAVAAGSEYEGLLAELTAADVAADRAWDAVKTPEELAARRADLRAKMIKAIGGFPARCPLNPVVTGTVKRDGYRVEKVMFESRPRLHVTALAFVPDETRFKPPYPAVAVTCGHALEGKAHDIYQRACVLGAKEGFLMLVYDPFGQGERVTGPYANCTEHNRFGAAAICHGRSTAGFRIWDGMRALDYLQSRSDVKSDRLGLMGNSGGGTMTSLIMALEPRLKAAAPSCYISTIRDVVRSIGPQDAEQCVWGQLKDGINHASLVLMADAAVRLQFSEGDFFPIAGAKSTYDVVRRTAERIGRSERYSATVVPGPHGWKESSIRSSLDWMRQWLMDEQPNGKSSADYAALDKDFDAKKADMGLSLKDSYVTPTGRTDALKGERTPDDVLVDDLIGEGTPRLVFRETVSAQHSYYGAKTAAEENAVMALMLGRSLIADRTQQILSAARAFAKQEGKKPVLVAYETWEAPAAFAFAAHPELFAGFKSLGDGWFSGAKCDIIPPKP